MLGVRILGDHVMFHARANSSSCQPPSNGFRTVSNDFERFRTVWPKTANPLFSFVQQDKIEQVSGQQSTNPLEQSCARAGCTRGYVRRHEPASRSYLVILKTTHSKPFETVRNSSKSPETVRKSLLEHQFAKSLRGPCACYHYGCRVRFVAP